MLCPALVLRGNEMIMLRAKTGAVKRYNDLVKQEAIVNECGKTVPG